MKQLEPAAVGAVLSVLLAACHGVPTPSIPTLSAQHSGTDARLQAVSAVDSSIAWVSGVNGTWLRTLDGGHSWEVGSVAGADSLEFRDVYAVSADTAYLLSAGTGDQSRIYRTTDGGASWSLQFVNPIRGIGSAESAESIAQRPFEGLLNQRIVHRRRLPSSRHTVIPPGF